MPLSECVAVTFKNSVSFIHLSELKKINNQINNPASSILEVN